MALAFLTLVTGLAISAVAIYYSVIGLAAIFSAAVVAIMVMGAILEVAKLVAAWWLKANWDRAPFLLKSYMLVAVVVLMLITSMGIFGFLSKAHTDQAIVTGDVQAQVYLFDEQIRIERENIANAQSLIKQLDDAVIGIQAAGNDREIKQRDGSTVTQSSAERALQVRRAQARDRSNLTSQIEESQTKILALQQKKAPIAANMREVEAKVGPIKYIAQLIYGEDPDENLLEKAVTWVIITIVFVFDPLAVLLLLASQMSFQWARQEKEERKHELVQENTLPEDTGEETYPASQPAVGPADQGSRGQPPTDPELPSGDDVAEEANRKIALIEREDIEPNLNDAVKPIRLQLIPDLEKELSKKDALEEWNEMIAEVEKAAAEEKDLEDDKILEQAQEIDKTQMKAWKADHPESSLKIQKQLLHRGKIEKLPWENYLKAKPDFDDNDAAEEAAKWALEQLEKNNPEPDGRPGDYVSEEEPKKKDSSLDGDSPGETGKEVKLRIEGYIQNAEQNDSTIWQRVKKAKEDE